MVIGAAALCVFLAGVWQILFGLFRVAGIIKFTPHPVFAGFVNGAALLIIKAQIKPFFFDSASSSLALPSHPLVLAFVLALALLAIFHSSMVKKLGLPPALAKVPGTIVAFALGILVYHLAKWIQPTLDLGPTIGKPADQSGVAADSGLAAGQRRPALDGRLEHPAGFAGARFGRQP